MVFLQLPFIRWREIEVLTLSPFQKFLANVGWPVLGKTGVQIIMFAVSIILTRYLGKENLGDYQTKHHNSAHHKRVRPFYQHTEESPRFLPRAQQPSVRRGCVETGANQPYLHRTPLPKISSRYRPDAAPAA